jgi:hypothetical protein
LVLHSRGPLNTPLFVLSSKHSIEMQNDHLMKVVKPLAPPVGLDTEPFDLNVSCLLEDHDDLEEGGATSPPSRTCMQVALPAASLDHSHHPHSIQKHPTFKFSSQGDMQQQILDITFSDNEADEALGPSEKKPPLSSPSKVLQKLDSVINLCRALALPAASSSARKSPPPPRALQPFPSAFEEELSDNDDEKGYPSSTGTASNYHSPQTLCSIPHTAQRVYTTTSTTSFSTTGEASRVPTNGDISSRWQPAAATHQLILSTIPDIATATT